MSSPSPLDRPGADRSATGALNESSHPRMHDRVGCRVGLRVQQAAIFAEPSPVPSPLEENFMSTFKDSLGTLWSTHLRRHGTPLGMSVILGCAVGCVTQSKYDHARAAMRTEHRAHEATAKDLYQAEQQVAEQRQQLAALHHQSEAATARAENRGEETAEVELDRENLRKQYEEQAMLVAQLRHELSRTGKHLRTFAKEREDLQERVEALTTRAALRAEIVRDLTFALHDALAKNEVSISVSGAKPVVRIPSKRSFVNGQAQLNPEALQVLGNVGRTLALREDTSVEVSEKDSRIDSDQLQMQRLQVVADTLAENGIPFERMVFAMPETLEPDAAEEEAEEEVEEKIEQEVDPADKAAEDGASTIETSAAGEEERPIAKLQIAVELVAIQD